MYDKSRRGQLCQGWPASFPESFQVHTSVDVSLFLPLCATVTCLFLFDDGPLLNYQRSNEPSQCLANLFLPLLLLTSIRPLPLVFSRNLVFVSNTNFRSHRIGHTAFLHFTRACLRLIGNKIRKGESYVYASFIYIYTGESSNESNNIYFGLITLFRFRSFIRVCNVEREGAFGNSSFEIYKSWKFGIYFMD